MNYSSAEFLAMGSMAAQEYISGGVPLDVSIAKIAEQKDLSRIQIQRVVELANHEANDRLMKVAEDKTFKFAVASVDGVLSNLSVGGEQTKVSEFSLRRSVKSIIGTDNSPDQLSKLASMVSEAPEIAETRVKHAVQSLEKVANWLVAFKHKELSKQAGLHEDIRRELVSLSQFIKDHAANGGTASELHKFACLYDSSNGRMWDVVFNEAKDHLVKEAKSSRLGYTLANEKIPASSTIKGTTVINGNHRLVIHLDTLKHKISAEDACAKRIKLLDTFGPAVVKRIQEFKGSADVQKHVVDELRKHAEFINDPAYFYNNIEKIALPLGVVSAAKTAVKHPVATAGALAIGGLGLKTFSRMGTGAGKAINEGTRDWRPGAYRGVDEGANI